MGMTMTQKILARAAGVERCRAGELLMCKLDLVLGNDITAPVAINEFRRMGAVKVFDPAKIALIPDHFVPNKDIKAATLAKQMREFARAQHIVHYYEVGRVGIEHALLPEQGIVAPGEVIIGADSHTCTYGAVGAFSTGVGSTDMAVGMATGECWFKVPEAVKVVLTGKMKPWVSGKDVILHLIGEIGVDGALYQSLEFTGDGVKEISHYDDGYPHDYDQPGKVPSDFVAETTTTSKGATTTMKPAPGTTKTNKPGETTKPGGSTVAGGTTSTGNTSSTEATGDISGETTGNTTETMATTAASSGAVSDGASSQPEEGGGSMVWLIVVIAVVVVLAGGGAAFYFLYWKKKH